MHIEGNNALFAVALVIHVLGAIAGIGPTFTFAVLGPLAEKMSPQGGLALLEGMEKIEKVLVNPVYFVAQPVSGVLMIFTQGLHHTFFKQEWLVISIVIYIAIGVLVYTKNNPALSTMIRLAKEGNAATPEFGAAAKITKKLGPIFGVMTVAIIVLMIWKPGSECGPLLRC